MSKKPNAQKTDPEVQIEEVLSKSELFMRKQGKKLFIILVVIMIATGAYFAYNNYIQGPKEAEAVELSFVAQQLFAQNEFDKALIGDGINLGFEQIAQQYSGTAIGNLSNHYMGICYLNIGEFQKAVNAFVKYDQVDGIASQIINSQNFGLTGDAYAQLGELDLAYELYRKAAAIDNSYTSPYFMKKAGLLKLTQNDKKGAMECFEAIKNSYPTSLEARDIDKYIGLSIQ